MTDYVTDVGLLRLADGSLYTQASYSLRYSRESGRPSSPNQKDERTETEKDRGRIGYSHFLRRLSGVTQVVSPEPSAPIRHSRESHSHKVALVAREIAEHLTRLAASDRETAEIIAAVGGLDISACQAAGLAHDLGHPPFGHAGEVAMNSRLINFHSTNPGMENCADGFEGNAQSFRIVTKLDRRMPFDHQGGPAPRGLDLTFVTLAAILKYPTLRPPNETGDKPPKFGAFETERSTFDAARAGAASALRPGQQTLEASAMDLADDITYAIHDLEDFYRADLIDFGRVADYLRSAPEELRSAEEKEIPNPFVEEARKLASEPETRFDMATYQTALVSTQSIVGQVFSKRFSGSAAEMALLRWTLSGLVSTLFSGIHLTRPSANAEPLVSLRASEWHLMQCLKLITRAFVVKGSRMGLIERAQTEVIGKLFDSLATWLTSSPKKSSLPQPLRDYILEVEREARRSQRDPDQFSSAHLRAIADYICGLSDAEALSRANWLAGRDVPGMSLLPSDT